jgi:hypothetical protein
MFCFDIDVFIQGTFKMSHGVSMLHYHLFCFANKARNHLMGPHDKRRFSADILWAAITASNPTEEDTTSRALSLILPQFAECLSRPECLKRVPLDALCKYMKNWSDELTFPKDVLSLSRGIEQKCLKAKDDLEIYSEMLDELVGTLMPIYGLNQSQSLNGLERLVDKTEDGPLAERRDEKTGEMTTDFERDSEEASEEKAKEEENDDESFEFEKDGDPTTYIRDTLLEIGNWLTNTLAVLGDIARNPLGTGSCEEGAWKAPGQLELDVDSLADIKKVSAGCLRLNLMEDLRAPKQWNSMSSSSSSSSSSSLSSSFSSAKSNGDLGHQMLPDISIVYNIISDCDKAMALYDCFDRYTVLFY